MTNQEIEQKLTSLVRSERKITRDVIETIALAEKRRIYIEQGHASLFDYLTNHHGYSNPAANRRADAARAFLRAPFISEKLEDGSLNLTNVSRAQSMIKAHERKSMQKVSAQEYEAIFRKLENKNTADAEKILHAIFPDNPKRESKRQVSENEVRLFVTMPIKAMENIDWLKSFWSHIFPEGKYSEVIDRMAQETRERYDKKPKQEKPDHETTGQRARKLAMQRAQNKCEFVDPRTGQKCNSTYQVQVDHIVPRALGGPDNLENMRCLCRQHNLHMAEMELGKQWANHWRQ